MAGSDAVAQGQTRTSAWAMRALQFSVALVMSSVVFSHKNLFRDLSITQNSEAFTPDAIGNHTFPSREKALQRIKMETLNSTDFDASNISSISNASNTRTQGRPSPTCLQLNTQKWIDSRGRLGNYVEDSQRDSSFINSIISYSENLLMTDNLHEQILRQSLCHTDSNFVNLGVQDGAGLNNKTGARYKQKESIHFWAVRLIYYAIHVHQHRPAIHEARVRMEQPDQCVGELERHNIGSFDFECPDTKFLVISLGRIGLGAVFRLGAVNGLIAGLALNRTVLIVNDSAKGNRFLRQPWPLASCNPRRDIQCFFMPPSPCALTQSSLDMATTILRDDARAMFKTGELPVRYQRARILTLDIVLRPQRMPPNAKPALQKLIFEYLIEPLEKNSPNDHRLPIMKEATQYILEETKKPPANVSYPYYGAFDPINHAALFYTMRPNSLYRRRLDGISERMLPSSFDPRNALGLPIRASDKCKAESECLSYDKYMTLAGRMWQQRGTNQDAQANILVTSESPEIRAAQREFNEEMPMDYRVIDNPFDISQGTGDPSKMRKGMERSITNSTTSMEDIMLASISSLMLQLNAHYTVLNCCSNFHLVISDFLRGGCGAAPKQMSECMQDNEDPAYRLCCQWSKREECAAKKAAKEEKGRQEKAKK